MGRNHRSGYGKMTIPGTPDLSLNDDSICAAPSVAYRAPDVWHMGLDAYEPLEDDERPYKTYQFLGRIAADGELDSSGARKLARAKYHPEAKVFKTPRWFVCYRVL